MTLYALKPRFQALLRPLVAALAERGVSANQVTVLALLGSLLLGSGLLLWPRTELFLLLPLWCLLRMALNAIDGLLAREHGQKSALGGYLNELADVLSDAALFLPFAFLAPFEPFWVGAVIFGIALCEFAGVLGPLVGASRRYDGPLGKSDRAVVLGGLGLWVGLAGTLPVWIEPLMPLLVVLLAVTGGHRVYRGLAELER